MASLSRVLSLISPTLVILACDSRATEIGPLNPAEAKVLAAQAALDRGEARIGGSTIDREEEKRTVFYVNGHPDTAHLLHDLDLTEVQRVVRTSDSTAVARYGPVVEGKIVVDLILKAGVEDRLGQQR